MAIYHLSTKPISRSSGRSAVASIAYRAGIEIKDERLGKTYDYTKRNGVLWTGLATPHGFNIDRNELWNRAEKTETRSNSRTAREIVINIPHELMQGDQSAGKMLAYEFATNLSQKYQIAVDVAVHAPDKQGDNRNYHAHLLLTTRQIEQTENGIFELGKKSQLEMSNAQLKQAGLLSNQDELKEIRREWAELANEYLAERNIDTRIDHRSHKDRGLETLPTVKMGWKATELERQGIRTEVGDQNRAIKAYNAQIEQKNELKERAKAEKMAKIEPKEQSHPQSTSQNAIKSSVSPVKVESISNTALNDKIAYLERFKSKYDEVHHFIHQSFTITFFAEARKAFEKDVKKLSDEYARLSDEYERIKQAEPRFFGRDKWEQDRKQYYQLVMQAQKKYLELDKQRMLYSPSLTTHDKYTQTAFNELMRTRPELMQRVEIYDKFCSEYRKVLAEVTAEIPDFTLDNQNKQVTQFQQQDQDKGKDR